MKRNNLPPAILLDMDDTILSDSTSAEECWQSVCNAHASCVDGLRSSTLREAIRAEATWYWSDRDRHRVGRLDLDAARREIVAAALRRLGVDDGELAGAIALDYGQLRDASIEPFPGAIATLRALRERNVRLALLTNGNAVMQRRKIEKHGLAEFFDCILIEGEFGIGKPDARVYRHALDQLDVSPASTWMVGDNLEWEVAAPQRLGIFAIWLDFAGRGLPPASQVRPDRIIRSLTELLEPATDPVAAGS